MAFKKTFLSSLERRYPDAISDRTEVHPVNVIPTGSLALDYALGTGGFSMGTYTGIFGSRNVGKSTLALSAAANAQKMGLSVGWIAIEAGWDWDWAEAHGVEVDGDQFVLLKPNYGEEAFEMLGDLVQGGANLVVMDSLGALMGKSEMGEESKGRMGGQSGLITDGVKRWQMPIEKNNVCVLMINQVREVINSMYPGVKQPGGRALEFHEGVIIELKPGKDKFTHPADKDIVIGREVVAVCHRTKRAEGDNMRARYAFYNSHVEGKPFGIDKVSDVVNVGKKTGVIQGTTWLYLPDGTKHQGAAAAGEYIMEKPEVYEQIREQVLERMVQSGGKLEVELRVVDG